ncbi:hypothetical protein COO60DRAFT_795016 [Scenedesmus sp. NREL 46B-D3]|nr:hypothetical protein COO60DRAFT_795016 [Scenedesmus sp. NREL 46B-D3]
MGWRGRWCIGSQAQLCCVQCLMFRLLTSVGCFSCVGTGFSKSHAYCDSLYMCLGWAFACQHNIHHLPQLGFLLSGWACGPTLVFGIWFGFHMTRTSPVFEPMTGSLGNHLIHQSSIQYNTIQYNTVVQD